jgi:SAM-dependent methyltransferase
VLTTTKDLKTSACTAAGRPPPALAAVLRRVPAAVTEKFYGCGAPLPLGVDGLRVLDLGSGSGRDCYAAAALVGESGTVVGLDMTDEQLEVARAHAADFCANELGYASANMRFVKGYMEDLAAAGVGDASVDLIISKCVAAFGVRTPRFGPETGRRNTTNPNLNPKLAPSCVINLSPDKPAVLREAYRALAPGGELYFSDVYADRRVPKAAQKDEVGRGFWEGRGRKSALYTVFTRQHPALLPQ